MRNPHILWAALLASLPVSMLQAQPASPPQSVTLSIYDQDFALVNELRRITMPRGDGEVVVRQLPAQLEPSSAVLSVLAGQGPLNLVDQRFEFDAKDAPAMLNRYLGRSITVRSGTSEKTGRLLAAPADGQAPLLLRDEQGGEAVLFDLKQVREVIFPGAEKSAFLEPTLVWRASSAQEGLKNVRLSYMTRGLSWFAGHDVVLQPAGQQAQFSTRVSIRNTSGGSFSEARARLVVSEKGLRTRGEAGGASASPQRYAYGAAEPVPVQSAAGYAPVETYDLAAPVTIGPGETRHYMMATVPSLPVERFFVYDGVKFDRFQRNRRNDWNYGTEFQSDVDTHLEFENASAGGLGVKLPPGQLRLYQLNEDGSVDFLGDDHLQPVAAGAFGHVRVGPARGLRGERERTGYSEIRPLHEYEESFEIRLENNTARDVTVRVVEHLYRWKTFEIVRADAEYKSIGEQAIEFRPEVKAGGKRAIHYTVRYSW